VNPDGGSSLNPRSCKDSHIQQRMPASERRITPLPACRRVCWAWLCRKRVTRPLLDWPSSGSEHDRRSEFHGQRSLVFRLEAPWSPSSGWPLWGKVKDQHGRPLEFFSRRGDLNEKASPTIACPTKTSTLAGRWIALNRMLPRPNDTEGDIDFYHQLYAGAKAPARGADHAGKCRPERRCSTASDANVVIPEPCKCGGGDQLEWQVPLSFPRHWVARRIILSDVILCMIFGTGEGMSERRPGDQKQIAQRSTCGDCGPGRVLHDGSASDLNTAIPTPRRRKQDLRVQI